MLKNVRRLVCCTLILTILLMSSNVCFAADAEPVTFNESEVVLAYEDDGNIVLKTVDYENGDAKFSIFKGAKEIYTSFLKRDSGVVVKTNHETGITTQNLVDKSLAENILQLAVSASSYSNYHSSGIINAGTVKYQLYSQGYAMGISQLKVQYERETYDVTDYNLKGNYDNVAELASIISGALGITGILASVVALQVVGALGLTASIVYFAIPNYKVDADVTRVTWYTVGGGTRCIQGEKVEYYLHEETTKKTDYSDSYYPVTSITTQNDELALRLGQMFLSGYDSIEVIWD